MRLLTLTMNDAYEVGHRSWLVPDRRELEKEERQTPSDLYFAVNK